MPEIARYLITTADERTWKFDRPVIFLGEWCRLYNRKHIWESMDAVVAEPYGLKAGQYEHDIAYVQSLSSRLLTELVEALNTFHRTRHGLRYWNIVLGHWLNRYVTITFNRYFTLEQALKNHRISGSAIFESASYSLATNDSNSFIWACNDEVWNNVLCAKILEFWGDIKIEMDPVPLRGISCFAQDESNLLTRRRKIRRFILSAANFILPKFSRKNDAFIISSYLPLKEEILLQLSLGQWPRLWRSPAWEAAAPAPAKRQQFRIDAENYQGYERFVRCQLLEMIPSCYLEGYNQLVQQANILPWPTEPKFIFTSNNFDMDEVFKVWAAAKVEKGVPYITGQHGNNYGTHLRYGSQYCPERATADKFITWGWRDANSNTLPGFIFKLAGSKSLRSDSGGGLLLIGPSSPFKFGLGPEDDYYKFGICQEELFRFVAALPEAIKQRLTVRLHPANKYFGWSDEQRWKDRSPHTKIETGAVPLQHQIAQSRLILHSYDSTGILETLALNIPTMCFWHGGLAHLLPAAKPYYELLREANILADSPEQAAEFITLHWDNVNEWWESAKVQNARKTFCERYARTEEHPVRTMKRLLTAHI